MHDDTHASVGDVVVTRRNNRRLLAGTEWVRNGDRWHVTTVHDDGSLTVRRPGPSGPTVQLPVRYVAEHVELGYAVTAHRAQGLTVDTAHVIATPGMTRETLYVAMTRGRDANTTYTTTDQPDTEPHHDADRRPSAPDVLGKIVDTVGAEPSAHEVLAREQDRPVTIAQLAAEYDTLANAAQHHRWTTLVRTSGLNPEQADAVIDSDAFGALSAALRRAEAHHHDIDGLLPQVVQQASLDGADDPAAVLHHRVEAAVRGIRTRQTPRLIAGLIPHAAGDVPPTMRDALDQRAKLIEQRALHLAKTALANREPWTRPLGTPPTDLQHRHRWLHHIATVAAYRDRYSESGDGSPASPFSSAWRGRDDAIAMRARKHARLLSQRDPSRQAPSTHPRPAIHGHDLRGP